MNTFQNKIFELRKQKNYTQEELAKQLHVSRQAISKWENGISYPSMDILYNIAKLFETTVDELFDQNEVRINTFKNNNKIKNIKIITIVLCIIGFIVLSIAIISLITARKAYNLNAKDDEQIVPKDYQVGFVIVTSNDMGDFDIDFNNIESLGYPYYFSNNNNELIQKDKFGLFNTFYKGSKFVETKVYIDKNKCKYIMICPIYKTFENKIYFNKSSWMVINSISKITQTTEEIKSSRDINFSIEINFINTLDSVKLIEFDINNNIINEKIISVEDIEYTLSSECLYIVFESKMRNENNQYYYTRELLTSSEINTGYFYSLKYSNTSGTAFNSLHLIPKLVN